MVRAALTFVWDRQPIMRFPIPICHPRMMCVDRRLSSSDFSLVSEISKPVGELVIPSVEKEQTL